MPGILALMAFGAGMGAGWVVIWEMDSGVIERLRVTPASRLALLLGTVLRDIVMFAVPGRGGDRDRDRRSGSTRTGAGSPCCSCCSPCSPRPARRRSSALGINLKQIGSLAAVVTGVQLPLTLLSGILLPLSLGSQLAAGPRPLQPHVLRGPGGTRPGRRGDATATVGIGFGVTAAAAALALWWGTRSYHKAMV